MSKGYVTTKSIAFKFSENKSKVFQSEEYFLWKINKNWEKIFDKIISEKCEATYLKNGKLYLNVNDSNIYYTLITYKSNFFEKINDFLEKKIVYSIEIKKINGKLKREKEKKETKETKKILKEEKKNEKNIELSKEILEEIEEKINKIDKKYKEYGDKLKKIAINMKKKEKYLLENGYVRCKICNEIHFPNKENEKCFNCYEIEENLKQEKMMNLIIENPYISESEAVKFTKSNEYIYYKVRDILAQRIYNELVYLCKDTKIELEENSDYTNEIRKEAKFDLELLIKKYVDYKIGTDNLEIYKNERKKIIKKLKNEINFKYFNKR